MEDRKYVKVPGFDGWNDDMSQAEVDHMLGVRSELNDTLQVVPQLGPLAVSGTYFEQQCPVEPTAEQTAHMLRNQLNPEAGAAVQRRGVHYKK